VINLMPTTMKEQIRYAKLNRLVLRYVKVTVMVVVVLAGIFGWALWQLQMQVAGVEADVTTKEATIAKLNQEFTPKAQEVSERLTAIKFVQTNQTQFSAVIADIAKVVPQGVSIDTMTLTGSDAAPVRIGFSAQSYQLALAFRNALMTSPRIAAADLEMVAANSTGGGFTAAVIIGFKPGQAK
jgi:Tfp pilus assembly protein PilN